jgi:hypothetical protein
MMEEILAKEEHANDMKTLLEWVRGSSGKSEAEVIAGRLSPRFLDFDLDPRRD